ncbi:MAG: hypothetical protein ACYTG0_13005, partial [Planctomycetota bacterium]
MTSLVEEVCDQFDGAWKSGQRPALAAYLSMVAEAQREPLLRQLLLLDFEYRHQLGERPTPQDYCRQLPGHAELIDRLLSGRREPAESSSEAETRLYPLHGRQACPNAGPAQPGGTNVVDSPAPHATVLTRTWPFCELPAAVLEAVLQRMHEVRFAPGEILIR